MSDQSGIPNIIFYITGLIIFTIALVTVFHNQTYSIIITIKLFELQMINLVDPSYSKFIMWIKRTPIEAMTSADLYAISTIIGGWIKWLNFIISIVFVVIIYKFHPNKKYSKTYEMKTLSKAISNNFTMNIPVLGEDLCTTNINEGPWRMALKPVAFMKKHNILVETKSGYKIRRWQANLVFTAQLGATWKGIDTLKEHEKFLFAIFCAFACYDREQAELALSKISVNSRNKKLDFSFIDNLLNKYSQSENIQKLVKQHHYTHTLFSSLLELARQSGIVSTSSFLWLKAYDRELWYVLNNVGRTAVYIEGAAVRAHWLYEKKMQRAISSPMIESAIESLYEVLKKVAL